VRIQFAYASEVVSRLALRWAHRAAPGGRPGPAVAPADPTSRKEAANAEVI
jgi:hypothetical protein